MGTKKRQIKLWVCLLALVVVLVYSLLGSAGSLQPSGAPGPTMKTLDEVEPRIPIHASDLPLTITQAGSYYLVEDVDFTSTSNHAIRIECNDVTIDLMGYTITGPNETIYQGIYINSRTNVEICNGTIRDFYSGIYGLSGLGYRATNIRAISNTQYGIILNGNSNIIKNCFATENANFAMYVGTGGTGTGNTAYNNGSIGFVAGAGCTVTGNTSYENTNHGISVGSNCTVTGNTAHSNSDNGINAGSGGCTIAGNTCYNNGDDGIYAYTGCAIIGNTARDNTNRGISAFSHCLIDQNTAYGNSTNIYTGTGCVLGTNCAP